MGEFSILLIQLAASLGLMTVGFNLRERNVGVLMLWLGLLCVLGVVLYEVILRIGA